MSASAAAQAQAGNNLFAQLDTNNDGVLSKEEFYAGIGAATATPMEPSAAGPVHYSIGTHAGAPVTHGAVTYAAPATYTVQQGEYQLPTYSQTAPAVTYGTPQVTTAPPVYVSPQVSAAPVTYMVPQVSNTAAPATYTAPQVSYVQPTYSYSTGHAVTYATPQEATTYTAPTEATTCTIQPGQPVTYAAPQTTAVTYAAPQAYTTPAEASTYAAPQQASGVTYVTPQPVTYAAPQHSTTVTYAAPQTGSVTYASPQSYIAPATYPTTYLTQPGVTTVYQTSPTAVDQAFDAIDKNHDGVITRQEAQQAAAEAGGSAAAAVPAPVVSVGAVQQPAQVGSVQAVVHQGGSAAAVAPASVVSVGGTGAPHIVSVQAGQHMPMEPGMPVASYQAGPVQVVSAAQVRGDMQQYPAEPTAATIAYGQAGQYITSGQVLYPQTAQITSYSPYMQQGVPTPSQQAPSFVATAAQLEAAGLTVGAASTVATQGAETSAKRTEESKAVKDKKKSKKMSQGKKAKKGCCA